MPARGQQRTGDAHTSLQADAIHAWPGTNQSLRYVNGVPYQRGSQATVMSAPLDTASCRVIMAYVRVQCYSGTKASERPIRFELDGREYIVEEIIEQWYGPDDTFFKLPADDNNIYILRHSPVHDAWSLESFRRG